MNDRKLLKRIHTNATAYIYNLFCHMFISCIAYSCKTLTDYAAYKLIVFLTTVKASVLNLQFAVTLTSDLQQKMIYQCLLTHLILLIWVKPQQGSVVITKPPQNQITCAGDNATITCGFSGSDVIPNWIINNMTFGNTGIKSDPTLYSPDVNNTNDTVLIMLEVTASMNGTQTQCEFQFRDPIYSSTAVLTIMGHPLIPNIVVTEVALDSFAVTWGTFSHDACGDIAYSFRLSRGVQLITENTTTGNGIHFTGLNHTTLYEVSVFATNNAGQGLTKTINVTTLTPAAPSPPKELKVDAMYINYVPTVRITWTSPLLSMSMTEVEAYNVSLYDKDQRLVFTILQSQTLFNLSEEAVKLNIRETYTVNVIAVNSVGYSPPAVTMFRLQWLRSAMISVLPDNKTILVTCEVASPQAECLVTINCTKCLDGLYNSTFFRQSLQLTITPGDSEYYVVTVQAIRTDNNDILEEHAVTETIWIPEAKKPSDDSSVQVDRNSEDDNILLYIVIPAAVLAVIVLGIFLISVIFCCVAKKRRMRSVGHSNKEGKIGYARHSNSSTLKSSYGEKDQTDYHSRSSSYNGKSNSTSYEEVQGAINYPDEDITTEVLPSSSSDSSASLKQETYSQVDMKKKHEKTNYIELGPFNTKQSTLMPVEVPRVQYTDVTIQHNKNKPENSS